jgi:outer membrane protein insertion porin family
MSHRLPATLILAGVAAFATPALAQQEGQPGSRCVTPDSVSVVGNARVSRESIVADAGIVPGEAQNYRSLQRAIRGLYATGQFEDVQITCDAADDRATLVVTVKERLVLDAVSVAGTDRVSDRSVRDRVDLLVGHPIDPAQVTHAVTRIDSLYKAQGYYLARIRPETTVTAGGHASLVFRVTEGRRLAISGVRVVGNQRLSDEAVVKAMKTRPEGFWWFRRGEFDEEKYAGDKGERVPELYASHGFIDFEILRDTLIVDEAHGKALLELQIAEGPQYRVGAFESNGNQRFNTEEINRFYPFTGDDSPTLAERAKGLVRRQSRAPKGVFDRERWNTATQRLQTAYNNEGYISAHIRPVIERTTVAVANGRDSVPTVNLRWDIEEGAPAIVNRVDIYGNDYTEESCIRDALMIIPGDVYNQDRLIRSWQNIGNMGFFETPVTPPDIRPANDSGDVDVVFRVKEKQTGSVNFGASMGQGTGVGGFIGLEQPNLFGKCKRGSLNWQFGRYLNDFSLSYTDPTIRKSRVQGTVTAYNSQSRFRIGDLGRSVRTGGSVQFGFPVPRRPFTRLLVSYGGEAVRYSGDGLLASIGCNAGERCFRSSVGTQLVNDTRIDLPFPTAGSRLSVDAQFNGGPLGGTASFQRYTTELRTYAPLGSVGGGKPGSQPMRFVLGLSGRAGMVFGDPGPFFYSQAFSLGGTQYGEPLRGYEEFSITPNGYVSGTDQNRASQESFGRAFFSTTAEVGFRVSQMLYLNTFFDAGNVWARPREFDPTRLFRGAGVGVSTVTPLGPLGIDWAYGFDRRDIFGRPDPKWQFHFKLGQLF